MTKHSASESARGAGSATVPPNAPRADRPATRRQPARGGQPAGGDRSPAAETPALGPLAIRGSFGGVLMGLANLVPGISGGTMLLAVGIYPRFIASLGEVTTLRFSRAAVVTLGSVVLAAVVAIGLLAGPVKELVVAQRAYAYSLFIGLTLGGVPVLWRLIGRPSVATWLGAAAGLAGMTALALSQQAGGAGGGEQSGFGWMLLAGVAAASAGILPGVSGGYLLLVLGVYVPLLAAVDQFKDALAGWDLPTLWSVGWEVVLPIGLGIALGVGLISNLLRWLLGRWEKATLGVLLGLLLGAVVGLYPFQTTVEPTAGDTLKGQTVVRTEAGTLAFEQTGRVVRPEDYPTRFFYPAWYEVGAVGGFIVIGFAVTAVIDRLGRAGQPRDA